MDKNRRNYYRLLRVQPDASPAVIRNNYRTLLQKLRLHPDLGGDHWNASLLNIAYNTLRHAQRREAYDRELLKQYHMKDLSQGHIGRKNDRVVLKTVRSEPVNQRNYYRILHIQTDSPTAIVHSSFQTLSRRKTDVPMRLLKEAHEVLGNPLKRALYDRLLQQYSHADAVDLLKRTFGGRRGSSGAPPQQRPVLPQRTAPVNPVLQAYSPVITRYCAFCKTPHQHSREVLQEMQCSECQSPLAPPSLAFTEVPRRQIARINRGCPVDVWLDWPDSRETARLLDLSPAGLQLVLRQAADTGQVIKIQGQDFKAVGEVTHVQHQEGGYKAGIRFLTIQFDRQRGQFVQTSI
ncbi:MAG: DnaJ domain-containing protein [Gammaproteobacteria bacterium]|nr:DnaJ domain-containing protein [Gammaproteobacteria bacterium]